MAQYRIDSQEYLANGTTIFEAILLSDKDGNIINSFGIASNIPIAAGDLEGWDAVHKFGAVPAMSTNTTGTVWDRNNTLYPWAAVDNSGAGRALTITVVEPNNEGSTSTAENGKTVTITGLDEDLLPVEETIAISGSGGTGSQLFRRVTCARINDGTNTKRILIKSDTTVVAQISENRGQCESGIYTIPSNKTGYLIKGTASAEYGADATVDMYVRQGGSGAFRIGHTLEVSGAGGQYVYEFSVPQKLISNTDIDVRATTRSNNGRYTCAFDLILIDNP